MILRFLCLLFIANAVWAHGDLHEQIIAVSKQIETEPNSAILFHKRGELHRAHQDFIPALADYDRTAVLDPKLEVVHLSRGRAQFEARRPEHAERDVSKFLTLHPKHPEALLLRARARVALEKRREAEIDFAAALEATPEPIPDFFLERAANLAALNEREAALEVIIDGLRRLGPLPVLDDAAIEAEMTLGRHDAALARIDARIAAAPRKEALLEHKARLLLAAGRLSEATTALQEALRAVDALPPPVQKLRATQQLAESIRAQLASKTTR